MVKHYAPFWTNVDERKSVNFAFGCKMMMLFVQWSIIQTVIMYLRALFWKSADVHGHLLSAATLLSSVCPFMIGILFPIFWHVNWGWSFRSRLLFWYNREREKDFVCEFFLSYLENLFWNIHCERKNIVASAFFRYGKRALFWSFRNEIERTNEIRFFFWSNVKKHDLYQKKNSGTRYEFLHVVK